jgi:hypothetical protein
MRRLIVIVAVACLTFGTAVALDPDPDSFCLYFDDGPCYEENSIEGPPGAFSAHMVIANPTAPSAGGLEILFLLDPPGAGTITGTTFVVSAVDVDDSPEGVVAAFAQPVLPNSCGSIYIGDLNLSALMSPTAILACPNEPASIPGFPAYLNGEDPTQAVPVHFCTDEDGLFTDENGCIVIPIAVINGEAPLDGDGASWTIVKGLYR